MGCLSVLYIQVFGDTYKRIRRAAHFLNNKHCKSSKLAVCGNSCKIRHYEKNFVILNRYLV